MDKRKLVGRFIELTDGWNKEVHNEIESRVDSEYDRLFPNNPDKDADIDLDQILVTKKKMREFYFERISFTANLLISVASFLVSVVAVVVAVGALIHSNSTPGAQPQGNTFMTSFMSIIAALLAAWFATIVAEDYRRYRDGQSLAAALYGELQAHLGAFERGIPIFKEIRKFLNAGEPLNYMPPFKPPADPVYDSGVARLGLLGPEVARDVAYIYQNINAFRAGYSSMTEGYSKADKFILIGMIDSIIIAATNAEERGKKALIQLDNLARAKYRILHRSYN